MCRKILATVLVVAAFVTAMAAVPGLVENVAFACTKGVDCHGPAWDDAGGGGGGRGGGHELPKTLLEDGAGGGRGG